MNKRLVFLPLLLSIAVVIGIFIGTKLNFRPETPTMNSSQQKIDRLIHILDQEYVDGVNTDSIVDLALKSIIESLDPHSSYVSAGNYEKTSDEVHGSFQGIGVRFFVYKDSLTISEVLPNGPAEKAGLKNGDRIIAIDDTNLITDAPSIDSVVRIIKGKANSKINLKIYRKATRENLQFAMHRGQVPIQSVTGSFLIDEDLAYIKIQQFTDHTYTEFNSALNQLVKVSPNLSLIIDLRDNSGGYVEQAKLIMEDLLPKGTLMYSTLNNKDELKEFYTKKGSKNSFKHIYVLLNQNSASASEMLAGAIQDNDLGTIVGRRSFGKGLVQVERPLGDGSAIWITIARYFTPTGRSIQRPYEQGRDAYFAHANETYFKRIETDSSIIPDSLKFTTPKGKIVYGGGGIYPDVYIDEGPNKNGLNIQSLVRHGFVQSFAFEYIDKNPNLFLGFDKAEYIEGYEVSQRVINEFMNYSILNNLDLKWEAYYDDIAIMLKAQFGKYLFGQETFYQLMADNDEMLNKVRELDSASAY